MLAEEKRDSPHESQSQCQSLPAEQKMHLCHCQSGEAKEGAKGKRRQPSWWILTGPGLLTIPTNEYTSKLKGQNFKFLHS